MLHFVSDAVLRNPSLGKITQREVEQQMMAWLHNARDRKGGRKQRDVKKKQDEANPIQVDEDATDPAA